MVIPPTVRGRFVCVAILMSLNFTGTSVIRPSGLPASLTATAGFTATITPGDGGIWGRAGVLTGCVTAGTGVRGVGGGCSARPTYQYVKYQLLVSHSTHKKKLTNKT